MSIAGTILRSRAVAALTSPHGVDRYLEQINPMWAAKEVRARVLDVRRETGGEHPVATITLQPTSTWRGHRAGQYVQVGVDLPGSRRTTRCFTISSAASVPGETIQLTVRAQGEQRPGQSVSRWLVERAQVGDIVHLSQAEGDFVLEESPATPTNNHLLFLTGGSGITPAMSILRTLLRDGYDGKAGRRVTFLHFARSAEDQIFAEELAQIAAADNDVDVVLRHGSVFSEFELRRLVPSYAATDTWACGPATMLDLVRQPEAAHRAVQRCQRGAVRRRRGRRRLLPLRQAGRQHRHDPARAGRGPGAAPDLRLSHGHLLLLHRHEVQRHRPQRPHR